MPDGHLYLAPLACPSEFAHDRRAGTIQSGFASSCCTSMTGARPSAAPPLFPSWQSDRRLLLPGSAWLSRFGRTAAGRSGPSSRSDSGRPGQASRRMQGMSGTTLWPAERHGPWVIRFGEIAIGTSSAQQRASFSPAIAWYGRRHAFCLGGLVAGMPRSEAEEIRNISNRPRSATRGNESDRMPPLTARDGNLFDCHTMSAALQRRKANQQNTQTHRLWQGGCRYRVLS